MKDKKKWVFSAILMLTLLCAMVIQVEAPVWAKDKDEGIPFHARMTYFNSGVGSPIQVQMDIPDGYRLIVDNFTAVLQVADGTKIESFSISSTVNGMSSLHHFPVRLMADNTSPEHDWYVAGETRLLFADAQEGVDTDLGVSVNRTGIGFIGVDFSVTGYLVPLK